MMRFRATMAGGAGHETTRRSTMRGIGRTVRNGIFTAGVLGSLGFGAAGVFAPVAEASAPPSCKPDQCNTYCVSRHGPFAHGECWGDECVCAI
jgi:hypothetical protein